jgi:hypothetical protein
MPSGDGLARVPRRRARALREHRWSTGERVALIVVLAIVMGSLFVTTYSLALGDSVPHRIDAAVHRPGAIPIPGTRRISYLEENVAAADMTLTEPESPSSTRPHRSAPPPVTATPKDRWRP